MTLLPTTSGNLEAKLEQLGERFNFDNPVNDLWDPDKCPVNALIYLAWALSVDNWSENWTEQTKRNIVKNSLNIHRLKGTSLALNNALNSLGYSLQIKYWYEDNSIPKGMFKISVTATNIPLNDEFYNEIEDVVNENKRGTLHLQHIDAVSHDIGSLKIVGRASVIDYISIKVA